jgi:hypothetical protein
MPLAWLVECKTCRQRFALKARQATSGKSTGQLPAHESAGRFECPHCHEMHEYTTDDFIPGEGKLRSTS